MKVCIYIYIVCDFEKIKKRKYEEGHETCTSHKTFKGPFHWNPSQTHPHRDRVVHWRENEFLKRLTNTATSPHALLFACWCARERACVRAGEQMQSFEFTQSKSSTNCFPYKLPSPPFSESVRVKTKGCVLYHSSSTHECAAALRHFSQSSFNQGVQAMIVNTLTQSRPAAMSSRRRKSSYSTWQHLDAHYANQTVQHAI